MIYMCTGSAIFQIGLGLAKQVLFLPFQVQEDVCI